METLEVIYHMAKMHHSKNTIKARKKLRIVPQVKLLSNLTKRNNHKNFIKTIYQFVFNNINNI